MDVVGEQRAEESLVGTLFADRFKIEAILGRGGMGVVYLAQHEVLQRRCAVKLIPRSLITNRGMAARFRQEARSASRVLHPHITSVFDFGTTDDGRPYLVMEYVKGPTLKQAISADGPFALDRALPVWMQIADALAAAHGNLLIHRDLKPQNIVLATHRGEPDYVKILDFGLAKVVGHEGSLSNTGEAVGTPAYMSPEQCMSREVDPRCDVYSFGVMAFEMIVGKVPFSGTVLEVATAHMESTPPLPSATAGRLELAPAVDAFVLRCLEKDPAARFEDGASLRAALAGLQVAIDAERRQIARQIALDDEMPTVAHRAYPNRVGSASMPTLPPLDPQQWDEESTLSWLRQMEPDIPGLSSDAIEEVACVLRDRGLGTAELSDLLAKKAQVNDRVIELQDQVSRLRGQISEVENSAREREFRLRRALTQLEHERDQARGRPTMFYGEQQPAATKARKELEGTLFAVSRAIQELSRKTENEVAVLQRQIDEQRQLLVAAQKEATEAADRLVAAVVQIGDRALADRSSCKAFEIVAERTDPDEIAYAATQSISAICEPTEPAQRPVVPRLAPLPAPHGAEEPSAVEATPTHDTAPDPALHTTPAAAHEPPPGLKNQVPAGILPVRKRQRSVTLPGIFIENAAPSSARMRIPTRWLVLISMLLGAVLAGLLVICLRAGWFGAPAQSTAPPDAAPVAASAAKAGPRSSDIDAATTTRQP